MADLEGRPSLSGLTEAKAQEFHSLFVGSFINFTIIAIAAHFLVWTWRPRIPGPKGYALLDGASSLAHQAFLLLS
jgi:light-harvesting complex 1 beta chain